MSEPLTFTLACPAPIVERDRIVLGHGSGGKLSAGAAGDIRSPWHASGRWC